jgi:hypothetical protein
MTFVFEKLDEASVLELRKKIPKFQHILSFSPCQVIDRDRDIAFVSLGGKGALPPERAEPPYFYALLWKGLCVAFEGYETVESLAGAAKVNIRLTQLRLPIALRDELLNIRQAIEAAMTIFKAATAGYPVSLSIEFPQATYY